MLLAGPRGIYGRAYGKREATRAVRGGVALRTGPAARRGLSGEGRPDPPARILSM